MHKFNFDISKLAIDVDLKERSLHTRADKLGIKTIGVGNKRVMEKKEYTKWRIILGVKKTRKRNLKVNWEVQKALGILYNGQHEVLRVFRKEILL